MTAWSKESAISVQHHSSGYLEEEETRQAQSYNIFGLAVGLFQQMRLDPDYVKF
jgi:hypothetical protein